MSSSKSVVVITGGASGIGKECSFLFAKHNYQVVIGGIFNYQSFYNLVDGKRDLNEANGKEVVAEVEKNGGEAYFVMTNVASEEEVKNLIDTVVRKYGRLDAAVNSAGIGKAGAPIHETTLEAFESVMRVNATGVFLSMKYEIQQFLKQGSGGVIVNMASIAGLFPFPHYSPYSTSKYAVVGLSKLAATENLRNSIMYKLIDLGFDCLDIRVNAVCPSYVDTPMVRSYTNKVQIPIESLSPIGRIGTPLEVAEAIYWLASPASAYVNGTTLTMDAGALPTSVFPK